MTGGALAQRGDTGAWEGEGEGGLGGGPGKGGLRALRSPMVVSVTGPRLPLATFSGSTPLHTASPEPGMGQAIPGCVPVTL